MSSAARDLLAVLTVGLQRDDRRAIQSIIGPSRWTIMNADDCEVAAAFLERHPFPVVIAAESTWRQVFADNLKLSEPAAVIVAARFPDTRLWAEVLNIGAEDVVPLPFHRCEALHCVYTAWRHWYDRQLLSTIHVESRRAVGA